MPQWAGSSWYFLRYIDPRNGRLLADPDKLKYWMNVDLYIGGAEHAVLHLLYARFWNLFLYDLGVVPTKEPFQKLFNQGMILGDNHEKMSKSKGNVVNPDDVVDQYGADTLRLYEMFMGPLDAGIAWSTKGLAGAHKFLERVYRTFVDENGKMRDRITTINDGRLTKVYNQTVKKVTDDFADLKFNTAIAQMMVFINEANKVDDLPYEYVEGFVKLLAPVAPHLMEEIWQILGNDDTITYAAWQRTMKVRWWPTRSRWPSRSTVNCGASWMRLRTRTRTSCNRMRWHWLTSRSSSRAKPFVRSSWYQIRLSTLWLVSLPVTLGPLPLWRGPYWVHGGLVAPLKT